MRDWESVGSLIESHRAKATRPDRRIFLPQSGKPPSASPIKATADDEAYEQILAIQNAADLEFPATDLANALRPTRIQTGHLPAGSSRPARSADADDSHAKTVNQYKRPPL
jgi:hypothetical protein